MKEISLVEKRHGIPCVIIFPCFDKKYIYIYLTAIPIKKISIPDIIVHTKQIDPKSMNDKF